MQDDEKAPVSAESKTFKKQLKNASYFAADYLSKFGRYICSLIIALLIRLGKNILRFLKFLWNETVLFRKAAFTKLRYLGVLLASPFLRIRNAFSRAGEDFSAAKRKRGFLSGVGAACSVLGDFVFGKSGIAVSLFNIAAPIVCGVFFFNIISYASSLNYAVKLTVNGKFLGYIENEQVYYDAETILKDRINYLGSEESILVEPEYSIELLENPGTLTKFQVADKMLEYSDLSVEYAYGFYLNGVFMGALFDNTEVKDTLNGVLDRYRRNYPGAEISFEDRIECDTAGLYLSGSIIDTDWLISQLTSVQRQAGYYIAAEEDTKESICEKLNISLTQLELMNPSLPEELPEGLRIKSREEVPFLSVNVTVVENYQIYVDYETQYYDDETLYTGVYRTTTEGARGVNDVTAKVTYVNGIETSREITATSIVSRPVTERIAQGTKPTPESIYSPEDASYGKFIWPTTGAKISEYSYADGGYYGHKGIDIVSSEGFGAPIFAGRSGKVIYAGNNWNGFGNYVIIDHGDGYRTLYAHCSALYVMAGDDVAQGEFIAALGMTGIATGPHVHFEVIYNGANVNPVNYLDVG